MRNVIILKCHTCLTSPRHSSGAIKVEGQDSSRQGSAQTRGGGHHQRSFSWPLAAFSGLLNRPQLSGGATNAGTLTSRELDEEEGSTIHCLDRIKEPHRYGDVDSHSGTVMSYLVCNRHHSSASSMMVPLNAPIDEKIRGLPKSASCGDLGTRRLTSF